LFSDIGELKRCGIHWDILGNSLGTADIEYVNPEHAKKAIEDFNSKSLIK
jgi:RNA recognition motif-containing protein